MRRKQGISFWLCLLSMAVLLAGCGSLAEVGESGFAGDPAGEWYVVERVVDGDTFVLDNGERVRLIGVDTPETVKPGTEVQAYGKEASNYTKRMLEGKRVRLEWDVSERDKYGRLLAYVYLEDGTFYNEHLLREGYARVMTVPPNVKYADLFLEAEREAREAGRGLWGLDPDEDAASAEDGNGAAGDAHHESHTRLDSAEQGKDESTDQTHAQRGLIKGNINSKGEKIYHVPGGRYYDVTVPEVWFETEEEARAAGFRRSKY